jgi:hypothetical protein
MNNALQFVLDKGGTLLLAHGKRQQVASLSQSSSMSPAELTNGREGGRGAESYNRKNARPSTNHSILADFY